MFLQQPHGFDGIAAQCGSNQGAMFALHIATVVVTDRARPATIQLGSIAQRQRHTTQSLIGTSGEERLVEPSMRERPLLAHDYRITVALHSGSIEGVMGGDHLALPGDVAVFDRHPQNQSFEFDTGSREIVEIVIRERRHMKAVLRLGLHQTLLGESGETFAHHAGTAVVTVDELGESQFGAGEQATRQNVGTELYVDLLTSRDRSQRRAMPHRLR
jgi:hypothetical protein